MNKQLYFQGVFGYGHGDPCNLYMITVCLAVRRERERKHCILNAVQIALAELEGWINGDKKCNGVA